MAISSKEWLCVLLNDNGASYYLDNNGVVKVSLTPKPLSNMFEGWADIIINSGRSAKYKGLERSYSTSYKFVKDGAEILRNLVYTGRGIESKVYIGLLKWNPDNGVYALYYKAEIDLVQANDDPKTGITVQVMQDGPAKYIKANESVVYEITCEDLTVNMDGVMYNGTGNFEMPDFALQDEICILPLTLLGSEGASVGIAVASQNYEHTPEPLFDNLATNFNCFFNSYDQTTSVRLQGNLVMTNMESVPQLSAGAYIFSQTALVATLFSGEILANETKTVAVDQTIAVIPGERLFLVWILGVGAFNAFNFLGTSLSLTFDTRFRETTCLANRPLNVFQELISNMSDGRYTGVSSLLEANKHLVLTSGDAIRGISGAKIKTSFSDFFESYGKILGGAIGINYDTQEVLFEEVEYFMDNTIELLDLGEVADLKVSIAKELVYNSIKVGYTSNKNEEAVAKEEVNAGQVYSTPITRVKSELNLIIPYRADIFGIEELRKRFFDLPNTDSPADNNPFILNINDAIGSGDKWNLRRVTYDSAVGGTYISTWYNIEQLTPKRILQQNGNLISGALFSLGAELVKFVSADKNANLITTLGSTRIAENGNLRISSLNPSYYRPFLLKFTTKVAENVVSLLQEAGRGYITGTWQGVRFYGFPQDLSVKPVFEESQEWTLLCSSLTNPEIFRNINSEGIIFEDMGIISHKLPIKFVRAEATYPGQYHFKQMDTDWFANRIGKYSQQQPYFQKWQTNDTFDIQFITQGLAAEVVIVDKHNSTVATVSLNTPPSPAIILPNILYQGTVDCSTLTAGETYWIVASFGVGTGLKQFISEPILIAEDWGDTVLIEYSNDINQTDLIWKAPYTGKIRVEGFIQNFRPSGRFSQYEDQLMDIVNLDSQPTRGYQLLVGGDFGIPDWMIDKINRVITLDNVTIDGFAYTIDKDAKLEPIETPGAPMDYWTISIKEAYNKAGIAIDASGENTTDLTVEYNIQTKGFSSNQSPANQQSTIIQVTDID